MPLDHKSNIKWYLGYCTKFLESFSSGNQKLSWHQSKRWELLNRETLCKLDGLRTVAKLKEKFYMKVFLTIAWNTFLQWGRLFPTSVASFWATKPNDMRQTYVCSETASEQSGNLALNRNKVTARHCRHLEAKLREFTSVGRQTEGVKIHRKLVTSILKSFHHFNRSSADNKHRTRLWPLACWPVPGNRSHA